MRISSETESRRRTKAFYNTAMIAFIVMGIIDDSAKSNEVIYTKLDERGERKRLYGARASRIYDAAEKIGIHRAIVKDVLDAMVMKSGVLERDMAVLRLTGSDGITRSSPEYVYAIRNQDLIDRAVEDSR